MTTPSPRSLPDTTLVSPASGLYSTRMPRLLTLSSHERNAAAVLLSYEGSLQQRSCSGAPPGYLSMGQPWTEGTPQHRPAMIVSMWPVTDLEESRAMTHHHEYIRGP